MEAPVELGNILYPKQQVHQEQPNPHQEKMYLGNTFHGHPVYEGDIKKGNPHLNDEWWAEYYNAEERPLEERVTDYNNAQSIVPTQEVKDSVDYVINSKAFAYEMEQLNISEEDLKEGMLNISKIESSGGRLSKEDQVSKTGAQGVFQIVESTARAVLEPNNYFGEKAAEAAGTSLETLRGMSREELQEFLLNNDKANALFSAAVIMQKLKHNENKNRGR